MSTFSFSNNFCINSHICVQTNIRESIATFRHLHSTIRIKKRTSLWQNCVMRTNQNDTLGFCKHTFVARNMYRSHSSIRRVYSIAHPSIAARWSCVLVLCCVCSVTDLNTYTLFLVIIVQIVQPHLSTHLFTCTATSTPDAIHSQTVKLNK